MAGGTICCLTDVGIQDSSKHLAWGGLGYTLCSLYAPPSQGSLPPFCYRFIHLSPSLTPESFCNVVVYEFDSSERNWGEF